MKYGINFATHWTLQFDWAKIPSIFVDNFDLNLGTWPSIDIDLAEGTAIAKESAKWNYDTTNSVWKLENYKKTAADIEEEQQNNNPGMIGIDLFGFLSIISIASIFTIMKKAKKIE